MCLRHKGGPRVLMAMIGAERHSGVLKDLGCRPRNLAGCYPASVTLDPLT